jgi:ABC-type phosphate/phosphonate transport system substrate-binding protein
MRWIRLGLAAGLLAAGVAGLSPAGDEPKSRTVRIGLSDTLLRDYAQGGGDRVTRPFQELLDMQTELTGEVVSGLKPDELRRQLKDGKLGLGVFQGFEYAWARQKDADLKPLMIAVNQQARWRALIVVRKENGAAGLTDLKGKSLAVARRTREPCRLFLDRSCQAVGREPKDFFARLLAPLTPEEAVDAVVNGQVDAALTDGTFLDWYENRKPARFAQLKTVDKSAVFPGTVVVWRSGSLDEATLRGLREGMLSAKDNARAVELMRLCQLTSFEPVSDDYDKLLTDIAKAYPAPDQAEEKK